MPDTIQSVLFDLDGTLLVNDLDVFMPRYFERLSARVSHLISPKQFVTHLMAATKAMIANDGQATNEDVFAQAFYPLEGHSRAELEPIFLDFYRRDFPQLRAYTGCRPEARSAVQAAFDLGYDVVIATNPLFPEIAIHERLVWAGVDGFPYRLVTTYENSRASKPNLQYYQQILDTIECLPAACLMVGNEPVDLAAGALGCATYLVTDGNTMAEGSPMLAAPFAPASGEVQPIPLNPTYQGTLGQLPALLRSLRNS